MPTRTQHRNVFHARRSRVVLDAQTVSWGENVEVPPESDEEDGTDNDEEGDAVGGGEAPGSNNTVAVDLDAIADGFVDDDFLKSDDDDDDDERCRSKEKKVIGHTANKF